MTLGSEAYEIGTIVDYIERYAKETPLHPALRFKGRSISYGELWKEASRLAQSLRAHGVHAGETVAFLLPNCPQFVIAELAVWMLGGRIAPMNPNYPAEELAALLTRMEATTVVVLAKFYSHVKSVQSDTLLQRIIVTGIGEYLPFASRLYFNLFLEKKQGHRASVAPQDLLFAELIRQASPSGLPSRAQMTASDIATILPSGGTTGTPKGVLGTHGAFVAAGRQLERWLASTMSKGRDEIMLPLPLFHVYGAVGVQGMTFVGGRTLTLIPDPRDINDVVKTIATVRPTFFAGVPTLFSALLAHPEVAAGRADFSSIRLCFSGAAALMRDTRERFERLTGGCIIEGYSLTEGQMAVLAGSPDMPSVSGSIGLPLPDVEVMIVDEIHGEVEVTNGQQGELIMRAPQITPGYLNRPEETSELLRTHADGTQWLYSGDIARMDDRGYFYLVDRKKDLIKISGFQVWPTEIEQVIATHPAVFEVGVTGLPDGGRGEMAGAWIVVRQGCDAPTLADIKKLCREHLAPYKVPSVITIVEALPKSPIGKILRRKLVESAPPKV